MNMQRFLRFLMSAVLAVCISVCTGGYMTADAKTVSPYDSRDFVVLADKIPDILQEIRYYSAFNFVGQRIDGYDAPVALMTKEAACALKNAAADFRNAGYIIKVYDTYRPQRAVDHFMRWARDPRDTKMKNYFYPSLRKDQIIPGGYVAKVSGHSKGSTIDMTLVDMKTGKEIDVGGHFDYFGQLSHHNFKGINGKQQKNRAFIKNIMEKNGFISLPEEWWHYTLKKQPFPNTIFNFPVSYLPKRSK
jgi:D-alanyl-D-alanine dipeptidase